MAIQSIGLMDKINPKDGAILKEVFEKGTPQRTRIIVRDTDTGEILADRENKIIITGSLLQACYAFNLESPDHTIPTYNEEMDLDNSVDKGAVPDNPECVCLFCVDDSGCGALPTEVKVVNFTDRISPETIMPFRYVNENEDLSEDLRKYYYGRKTIPELGKIAYYFKAFDTEPQLFLKYADGTMINGEEIWNTSTSQAAECFVETRLRINRYDLRDYFEQVLGWEKARISSISLCYAWYKDYIEEGSNHHYFQNIMPYTKLNFPLNWLVDLTKSLEFQYQIFY